MRIVLIVCFLKAFVAVLAILGVYLASNCNIEIKVPLIIVLSIVFVIIFISCLAYLYWRGTALNELRISLETAEQIHRFERLEQWL